MAILTNENEVYFAGMELCYKPVQFDLPKDAIVK